MQGQLAVGRGRGVKARGRGVPGALIRVLFSCSAFLPLGALPGERSVDRHNVVHTRAVSEEAVPKQQRGTRGCEPIDAGERPVPTDVKHLHPGDIKVVMALGDSITAAFGAAGFSSGLSEARGMSWSAGAGEGAHTLPNLVKLYSKDVWGGSVGSHKAEICYGPVCPGSYLPEQDRLNAAQSGAMVRNLAGQVDYLAGQLWATGNMGKWKLATLFIGANDVCTMCGKAVEGAAAGAVLDAYEAELRAAVTQMRLRIPRLFLSVVPVFNISQVYEFTRGVAWCEEVHLGLPIECECAFTPRPPAEAAARRRDMDAGAEGTRERTERVVDQMRRVAAGDPHFAVVLQPGLSETDFLGGGFPRPGAVSDLDCFHPSALSHEYAEKRSSARYMATALWNNLLAPAALKKRRVDPRDTAACPNATSLLQVF